MKKILIVEDDADINRALCIRLSAAGYEVHSAQDGYLGVQTAVKVRPDLLVLDISMPAGDGFSIVERLRSNTDLPHVPFIMLTASKRAEFRQTAQEMGASGYFEKPYESNELLDAIEEALASASGDAAAA